MMLATFKVKPKTLNKVKVVGIITWGVLSYPGVGEFLFGGEPDPAFRETVWFKDVTHLSKFGLSLNPKP